MTEIDTNISANIEFNKILGTLSSQKILQLLACWNSLSVTDISQKTKINESQTHLTLHNLEKINVIRKHARGIYEFDNNTFAQLLKQAYATKLEEIIGNELYKLSKLMDNIPRDVFFEKYKALLDLWLPMIKSKFNFQLASMAEYVVDTYLD